jgi:hypothetical protein
MVKQLLHRLKPGVSVSVHMLTAALIWNIVGFFLMINGWLFIESSGNPWLVVPGILIGTVKSLLVIDKTARRNISRVSGFTDRRCLGAVYSVKMWGFIGLMIVVGRFLRRSVLPVSVVGVIYLAVGWALFLSSRLMWKAWSQRRNG